MLAIISISILLVLISTVFYGFFHFYDAVEKEKEAMFNQTEKKEQLITLDDLEKLPLPLKNYLIKVGVLGKCKDCNVVFKQDGRIKTGIGKKWTHFTATQYMTASAPNFIWCARSYPLFIRDKSRKGQGEVRVNLFGLKDLATYGGAKTDQSALARGLGELICYPIGFLSDAISWELRSDGSLGATARVGETLAKGVFFFDGEGMLSRFESKRYMEEELESFMGIAEDFKLRNGLVVPTKMKAVWNLESGDFEYFNCTITDYRID